MNWVCHTALSGMLWCSAPSGPCLVVLQQLVSVHVRSQGSQRQHTGSLLEVACPHCVCPLRQTLSGRALLSFPRLSVSDFHGIELYSNLHY